MARKNIMKKKFYNLIVVAGLWLFLGMNENTALGMDRWAALSLLESGNNDAAVGRAGEVSRFQIKPALWERYCGEYPATARFNPQMALRVAQAIMDDRCAAFERHFHRHPTNFEYYILWNAPAQIRKPARVVAARANRFCNLVAS